MRTFRLLAALLTVTVVACSDQSSGIHRLPADERAGYETAYISAVVADAEAHDLMRGGGEHVVIHNRHETLRADLGSWSIANAEGQFLRIPPSTQLDPGSELRVFTSCGDDEPGSVFACLGTEFLADGGDVVRLLDSAGSEVATLSYGNG